MVDLLATRIVTVVPVLLGAFREFGYGQSAPPLAEVIGALEAADREAVANYLLRGVALSAVPGSELDVLDRSPVLISPSMLTDGIYVWREDL